MVISNDTPPISEFVENSPGIEVHRELMALQTSFNIQRRNYETLVGRHEEFRSYDEEDWADIDVFELIKGEYYTPFHNFVTSIYTVTNHCQRIVRKYGEEDLYDQYTNRISEKNLDSQGEFLRQLRHYTQKRKVPPIGTKMVWKKDEVEFKLMILKDEMLDWDGWNNSARSYLESIGSEVELFEIITNYQEKSENFQTWLLDYVRFYFSDELDQTLEVILLLEKMKSMMSEPVEEERIQPTIHGLRKKRVTTFPAIPEKFMHPYSPENILPDTS